MFNVINDREKNVKVIFVNGEFQCVVNGNMFERKDGKMNESQILEKIEKLVDVLNDTDIVGYDIQEKIFENGLNFENLNEKDYKELFINPVYEMLKDSIYVDEEVMKYPMMLDALEESVRVLQHIRYDYMS